MSRIGISRGRIDYEGEIVDEGEWVSKWETGNDLK